MVEGVALENLFVYHLILKVESGTVMENEFMIWRVVLLYLWDLIFEYLFSFLL